jgi:hypothetical protein
MTTAAWAAPYHAEAFSPLPGRCFRLSNGTYKAWSAME